MKLNERNAHNNYYVAIVDYGMGNLFSVQRACLKVGLFPKITSDKIDIMKSCGVVLPGVGAFCDAIYNLKKLDLKNPLIDFVDSGRPFLGICLGMQLLMTESEELQYCKGLDLIPGRVKMFDRRIKKIPQVGWNQIYIPQNQKESFWENTLLAGINNFEFMYFLHSYYTIPENNEIVLSNTDYSGTIYASSIIRDSLFACQFHPEISSNNGIMIFKNWANIIKKIC
jgi:glutamine amidotransferase